MLADYADRHALCLRLKWERESRLANLFVDYRLQTAPPMAHTIKNSSEVPSKRLVYDLYSRLYRMQLVVHGNNIFV